MTVNGQLAKQIVELMSQRGLKLAAVESCTGGQLAAYITAVPGASDIFCGGLIPYSNAAKATLLGVDWNTMDKFGAVSEECARELVTHGEIALRADYTIAITGIAGPDGGTDEKPVGTVYIAWAGPDGVTVEHHVFEGDRATIQHQAVLRSLSRLVEFLG
ncbi:CinA family protein [bacterium]|nr:CinA family protein [bacterium]